MGEKTFKVKVIESDDGGFEACVLGHSIYTPGEEWNRSDERFEKPCNAIWAETAPLRVPLSPSLAQDVNRALP